MLMPVFIPLFTAVLLLTVPSKPQQSNDDYSHTAQIDEHGNIYVRSEQDQLILMAESGHCSEAGDTGDRQTFYCFVAQVDSSATSEYQFEIYKRGGHKLSITIGTPLYDWHFSEDGKQLIVCYGQNESRATHARYEVSTAHLIEKFEAPAEDHLLPDWAKGRAQKHDEAVPMSPEFARDRADYLSKVLREIGKIRPGMTRQDLLKSFQTEGGISARTQRTFVYTDCPLIKVDVLFEVPHDDGKPSMEEAPSDVIKSISRPYLGWSVVD